MAEICGALKQAVAALREAEVEFMVGGSLAVWARGGPEPSKDLDLMLRAVDAERALAALERAGMRPERPPEEWLLKAWCEDVLVDLIFGPSGLELTDEVFERAEDIPILAISAPVMALEDVFVTKLRAMDVHTLDYGQVVAMARAVREQVDWRSLAARTADSPFARAFFTLLEGLGIADAGAGAGAAAASAGGGNRVRVLRD